MSKGLQVGDVARSTVPIDSEQANFTFGQDPERKVTIPAGHIFTVLDVCPVATLVLQAIRQQYPDEGKAQQRIRYLKIAVELAVGRVAPTDPCYKIALPMSDGQAILWVLHDRLEEVSV